MGSLMPGWDTQSGTKRIMERSRTSLTKDRIEEFWRHKQQEVEAHKEEASAQNANNLPNTSATTVTTTSVASDGTNTQEVVITWKQPTASSRDWWARSNWAYLNAPPEIPGYPEQPRNRPYVPQHEVASGFSRSVSSII